ncbi:NADPH-dependent FMN reductase [Kordiimonas pumila]|uniref:NADPH-dependent FMN reductase n=1 Tax=Kordiimonas pumila TaxID=2161677 RepID=A0ABV7D4T1_9PROT|nr:NADPH-dependent FMN reductase [Kordiimonas pumila]
MKILTICGSLRRESYNKMLIETLPRYAPDGWEFEASVSIGDMPHYSEDLDTETPPEAVRLFREQIESADALYWAMPEFNHSIPGVLKNALDWATHPLNKASLVGRIVAVSVVTQGRGGFRGMADLARILRDLGNFVIPAPELCVQFAHECFTRNTEGEVHVGNAITEKLLKVQLNNIKEAVDNKMGQNAGVSWSRFFDSMSVL